MALGSSVLESTPTAAVDIYIHTCLHLHWCISALSFQTGSQEERWIRPLVEASLGMGPWGPEEGLPKIPRRDDISLWQSVMTVIVASHRGVGIWVKGQQQGRPSTYRITEWHMSQWSYDLSLCRLACSIQPALWGTATVPSYAMTGIGRGLVVLLPFTLLTSC